jgi:2'-5' RNA ligase
VDVGGDTAQIFALQAAVEAILAGAGFPRENRPWRPHITLAQDVILKPGAPSWHTYNMAAGSFAVEEFALVLSEERDRRRVYTPINRFILGR